MLNQLIRKRYDKTLWTSVINSTMSHVWWRWSFLPMEKEYFQFFLKVIIDIFQYKKVGTYLVVWKLFNSKIFQHPPLECSPNHPQCSRQILQPELLPTGEGAWCAVPAGWGSINLHDKHNLEGCRPVTGNTTGMSLFLTA